MARKPANRQAAVAYAKEVLDSYYAGNPNPLWDNAPELVRDLLELLGAVYVCPVEVKRDPAGG